MITGTKRYRHYDKSSSTPGISPKYGRITISSFEHAHDTFGPNCIELDNRERQRQRSVNQAFVDLRALLPTYPPDKKLSKHEILRLSIKYIHVLEAILRHQEKVDGLPPAPPIPPITSDAVLCHSSEGDTSRSNSRMFCVSHHPVSVDSDDQTPSFSSPHALSPSVHRGNTQLTPS
ncbi:unnamed protein product [Echinostoma caproni]|uniref:BHLH domain-containing protein n=1 Tax=Echinostoma caproni TaxID=27848 RepID=A0A183AWP9_9TREM|nr:unnamed protein product [Echinostoma caproni]